MRYTHHFHIIRSRKHTVPISLFVLTLILTLVFVFGFREVDVYKFTSGFILSFIRVLIAYLIALSLSIIISLFITVNKSVEDIALPALDVLQSFPSFSVLPLLLTVFRQLDTVAVLILILAMIWPILFSILTGIKSQNQELLDAATVFGATGLKKITFITIPLIFPSLVTGSIVAWGEAWETILAAEIIIRIPGVGTYLSEAGSKNNSHVLIIGILLLLAVLFVLNKFFWIPLLNKSTKYQ